MDTTSWIRSLRAVREFSDRAIPDGVLLDILDTGRWTGSSENAQPWHLIVVTGRDRLEGLSRCGDYASHIATATLAMALVMKGDDDWTLMDEGRLIQNLMLGAWGHGIGSCVGSMYPQENERRAKELLGVPSDRHLRTVISAGYPAGPSALRLPPDATVPRGRRPLSDVVSWERFGSARDGAD